MNTILRSGRRKKVAPPAQRDKRNRTEFAGHVFDAIIRDMQSGAIPLARLTVSDDETVGLRAILRSTGVVTFSVHYDVDGSRPWLTIGHHPDMTVDEARKLARTVRALAEKGIDPQAGLHERLIRELQSKGDKWRP